MIEYRRSRSAWARSGLVGVLAMAAASSAWTQEPPAIPAATQLLLGRIHPNLALERYLENLRGEFRALDADSDGVLTEKDVALHALMEDVQLRNMSAIAVMRFDLDGDGFVTEDEIRRGFAYEMRAEAAQSAIAGRPSGEQAAIQQQLDRRVGGILAADTDKDGRVSYAEASKFGQSQRQAAQPFGQASRTRQALTLEGATQGILGASAYEAAGEALFRKVDADADGKISQQELADYRRQPNPADASANAAAKKKAGCNVPRASESAKVVLFSGYQTESLSSVTIGSQDSVVHAGRVVIEPGAEPLYVVLTSYSPTVWQFSGAVERVERLVMTSARTGPNAGDGIKSSLVGATGIAADKIAFSARSNCLPYFSDQPSSTSLQTVAAVRNGTGKELTTVATKYSVSSVSLPSGKIETLSEQRSSAPLIIMKSQGTLRVEGNAHIVIQAGPSPARDEMLRFFPGGVAPIDARSVVASAPVTPYEVLPSQAGIVQLLETGAISRNRSGEYVVRQKIRFPAGLAGAHSVTFLIMRGTPYPDGDPAHSCVVVEEGGESKGAACRLR